LEDVGFAGDLLLLVGKIDEKSRRIYLVGKMDEKSPRIRISLVGGIRVARNCFRILFPVGELVEVDHEAYQLSVRHNSRWADSGS
jgi:hypothetical protein